MTRNGPLLPLLLAFLAPLPAAAGDVLFERANLDPATPACVDFFQHADGGWIARNPIPPSEAVWERFNELAAHNRETLRNLLTAAAVRSDAPPESVEGKVGAFYASCMDEAAIEARGLDPIRPELARIAAVSDLSSLESAVAHLQLLGVTAVFGVGASPDLHDSAHVKLDVSQGGLGLPDRDYYFKDDETTKKIRDQYVRHVARLLELAGDAPEEAARQAAAVMALETRLAAAAKTRAQRREIEANYHKMTLAEMGALAPHVSWERWLRDLGFAEGTVMSANVRVPDFIKAVDRELTTTPLADWKTYLRWHLLAATAEALPARFASERFRFAQGVLSGTQEERPRWDRCVRSTDRHLGMALGQLYAEKAFSPEARKRARAMVDEILAALREDLATLPWMDEATRAAARRKLDAVEPKIGYPDRWLDYTGLALDRASYAANVLRADEREARRRLAKVGKPVERTGWQITPATVNAYYNASLNEIVFPAGILQPPFFDPAADDAYNYGAAGSMIGHELTHGFDDQGAKFDGAGNLQDWWSPSDLASFRRRAECVQKHFDGYTVQDLHLQGKLVEGEAIADLGGLKLAYNAYQRSLQGKPRQTLDGLTPEQRFFIGFAAVWAGHRRPEEERLRVTTNPHPLNRFRVDGSVSDLPEFAQAFGCKPGDPMARPAEERCAVW